MKILPFLRSLEPVQSIPLHFDGGNDSSQTILTDNGSTKYATVTLDGADFITFKNMTIETTATTDGWGVHLTNGADYNTILNCQILTPATGTLDLIGIVTSNSPTSEITEGNNANYLTVKDTRIFGGEKNIHLEGGSTGNFNVGNSIIGCVLRGTDDYGIYFDEQSGLTLKYNDILLNRSIYGDALYGFDQDGFDISNNRIEAPDYAVYISDANLTSSTRAKFINNIVISNSDYGLYIYDAKDLDIWFNSVFSDGNHALYLNELDAMTGIDVRNNMFISNGSYAINIDDPASFDAFDYNIFYSVNNDLIDYKGTYYSDLKSFQNAEPTINQNSLQLDPEVISYSNLHLKSTAPYYQGDLIQDVTDDIDGDPRCAFAATIGADEFNHPAVYPVAGFQAYDTVGVNSPVEFLNIASENDPSFHFWYVNDVFVNNNLNLTYTFNQTGTNEVKLITANCTGYDTLEKSVVIVSPTSPPEADFIADKNIVEQSEVIQLTDQSENWPTTWAWKVIPDSIFDPDLGFTTATYIFNPSSQAQNPELSILYPGSYSVSLTAGNTAGNSQPETKTNYIVVKSTNTLCNFINESRATSGNLYDDGGATTDYSGNQNCNFLINPCASQVKLVFWEFDLNSSDYIRIYDGKDNTGTPLWDVSVWGNNGIGNNVDRTHPDFDTMYIALSGSMYIEFESNNSTTTNGPGFYAEWSSKAGNFAVTDALFNGPDTVCVNQDVNFENLSTGDEMEFFWDFESDDFTDATTKDATYKFAFAGDYSVKLTVDGCGGQDVFTKDIHVYVPYAAPMFNFSADNTKPLVDADVVSLNSELSNGCANTYSWVISPSSYDVVGGSLTNSNYVDIVFHDSVYYDVALIAGYDNLLDSVEKPMYIKPIRYCEPAVSYLNSDIGINEVSLGDISQLSESGVEAYSDYSATQSTVLEQGAQNVLTVSRNTSFNPVNIKVWLDLNFDGNFDDNTELIDQNSNVTSDSWQSTFVLPSNATVGTTKMRIGVSQANKYNMPCGVNYYGEFEDYKIIIAADETKPVITLIGNDTIYIQQCGTYTEPGYAALDNVDGDITLNVNVVNNINPSVDGVYFITYNVDDHNGNSADEVIRVVVVENDQVAPQLTLNGNQVVELAVYSAFIDPGYLADDVCSGIDTVIISGTIDTAMVGTYMLTYKATDMAGNTTTLTRTVNVVDTIAPILSSVGTSIILDVYDVLIDPVVDITDNYYTDFSIAKSGSFIDNFPNGQGSVLGDFKLLYSVKDGSGNESTITFDIRVVDRVKPDIEILGQSLVSICRWDTFDDPGVVLTDNYDMNPQMNRTGSYISNYMVNFGAGLFELVYEGIDASGNVARTSRIIEVRDDGNCISSFDDIIGENQISIYPNPARDILNINIDNYQEVSRIQLINTLGEVVNEIDFIDTPDLQINTSTLSEGMYLVNISFENRTITKQISIIK
jgi:PKD repeat protein